MWVDLDFWTASDNHACTELIHDKVGGGGGAYSQKWPHGEAPSKNFCPNGIQNGKVVGPRGGVPPPPPPPPRQPFNTLGAKILKVTLQSLMAIVESKEPEHRSFRCPSVVVVRQLTPRGSWQ